MAKFLVETFYTCSFKVSHYLDDINEANIQNLEKREDGKFEILDVKLDNRKTKNLDPNNNKIIENNNKTEKKLNELLREFIDVDLVIVEGFKNENHPKIEIIGQNSKIVNNEIKNVVAIVADQKTKSNIPLFMRNDVESLTEFIINKFL